MKKDEQPSSGKPKPSAPRKSQKKCSNGKIIYDSQGQATKAIVSLLEVKGWRMKEYKCNLGKHWHLTHQDADERRRDHRYKRRMEAKKIRLEKKKP